MSRDDWKQWNRPSKPRNEFIGRASITEHARKMREIALDIQTPWISRVHELRAGMNAWERSFVASLYKQIIDDRNPLSKKQRVVLSRIAPHHVPSSHETSTFGQRKKRSASVVREPTQGDQGSR